MGERFEIRVPSNPTTGYKWFLKYNEVSLHLAREEYVRSSEHLGAAGHQVFTFMAKEKGETHIFLEYKRSWESLPLKESEYEITIE